MTHLIGNRTTEVIHTVCSFPATELRWLLPAFITAIGIFFAVRQPGVQRRRDRVEYADAAAAVASEAIERVYDRLIIRFDPPTYTRSGRHLRQHRGDSAVATLLTLKVDSLPPSLIPSFSRIRAGLEALNTAMNEETEWPPGAEHLARYRVVYDSIAAAIEAFNCTRGRAVREIPSIASLPARKVSTETA